MGASSVPRPIGLLSWDGDLDGNTCMSVKLKAGSMELETAFIDWLRTQGYNPPEGIEPFFQGSDFVRTQLLLIHDSEKQQLLEEARQHLVRRSRDPMFAGQFPAVHECRDRDGRPARYTVNMTLSDDGAEWIGRAWSGGDYLGEIHGSVAGRRVNYLELACQHVEAEILARGAAVRQG